MKKQYRVKKNKEIEAIMKNRLYASSSYFIVYTKKTNETSHFRYAVSVSKKLGNAVFRNHLKRQVRAIVRQTDINDGQDFFIILRPKVLDCDFFKMKDELQRLFDRLKLLRKGEKDDSIH